MANAPSLAVSSLDAIVTSACNLRCSYCYQAARSAGRMGWEILRACVDLLLASECDDVQLVFYGGEPLLEFPTIRRAVNYAETAKPRRQRVRYGIVTNGILLGSEVAAFLDEHRFETRLSFDGVPASQDLRARGTFPILDRLLVRLRSDNPRFFRDDLSINITLHSGNLRYLPDSIEYFLEKGIRSILLGPMVNHDDGWRLNMIEDLDARFSCVFQSCLVHYSRSGEVPLTVFRKTASPTLREAVGRAVCGVGGGTKVAVDPSGNVHGCVMLVDAYQSLPLPFRNRLTGMKMGNLLDVRFEKRYRRYPATARAARIFNDRHLKYSSYGRCDRCRFAGSCSVCPVAVGYVPYSDDPHRIPDHVCAYNLVSLDYRDRFPSPTAAEDLFAGKAVLSREMSELRAFVLSRPGARGRRLP